jgi:hypothetical protein
MTMTDTEDKTLPTTPELFLGTDPNNPDAATVLPDTDERKAKQLPDPSGYRILCALPEIEEKTAGGIYKADSTMHYEELTTPVLLVAQMRTKTRPVSRQGRGAKKVISSLLARWPVAG